MKHDHDRPHRRSSRVAEPVQVYLKADEQERLARLTERLGVTKSEALRRGLEALERQVTDPDEHPALAIIGIARVQAASGEPDAARDHDEVLAEGEIGSWRPGEAR